MHHNDPDATNGPRAGQQDTVGLGRQRVPRREGVLCDESPDRFAAPNCTNAIRKVENPRNLTAEAVNFQGKAAHSGVAGRCLDLSRNSLIAGLA